MSFDFDIDAEEEWFDDSAPIYDFPNLKTPDRYRHTDWTSGRMAFCRNGRCAARRHR